VQNQEQPQIPFGDDKQNGKGKTNGNRRSPFGDDKQKSNGNRKGKTKSNRRSPFGDDKQKGNGKPPNYGELSGRRS
jgi:hypothetical protein